MLTHASTEPEPRFAESESFEEAHTTVEIDHHGHPIDVIIPYTATPNFAFFLTTVCKPAPDTYS